MISSPVFQTPMGPRALGRDTEATQRHWSGIIKAMPVAPRLMMGALPQKSPPLWKFINPRIHHQVIGMCVGRGGTRMCEYLARVPAGATADSTPGPTIDMSSLWTYQQARKYSFDHGVNLGGEGAIVSHMIMSEHESGMIPLDLWPDDNARERAYSDRTPDTSAEVAAGKAHVVKDYAILDTRDKIYQYMSQGYAVATGIPITNGWFQCDEQGNFHESGAIAGGHCTVAIGYDLTDGNGWVAILNSWPQWGRKTTDPFFPDNYTNIGYMPAEQFDQHFSPSAMQSGEAEAVVASSVVGFAQPLVTFDFTSWYGSAKPA